MTSRKTTPSVLWIMLTAIIGSGPARSAVISRVKSPRVFVYTPIVGYVGSVRSVAGGRGCSGELAFAVRLTPEFDPRDAGDEMKIKIRKIATPSAVWRDNVEPQVGNEGTIQQSVKPVPVCLLSAGAHRIERMEEYIPKFPERRYVRLGGFIFQHLVGFLSRCPVLLAAVVA